MDRELSLPLPAPASGVDRQAHQPWMEQLQQSVEAGPGLGEGKLRVVRVGVMEGVVARRGQAPAGAGSTEALATEVGAAPPAVLVEVEEQAVSVFGHATED